MGNFSTTPTPAAHENPGRERDLGLRARKRTLKKGQPVLKPKPEKAPDVAALPEVEPAAELKLDILA